MKNQVLKPWVSWFIITSCLMATSAIALPSSNAVAAPTQTPQPARLQTEQGIQPLTCVQDTQGLMCSTDAQAALPPQPNSHPVATAALLSPQQLGQISDSLIDFLYFVCPVGLVLAIVLHDKNDAERTRLLNAQVEALEKIWKQNPNRFEH
jgi:hypothetical protein